MNLTQWIEHLIDLLDAKAPLPKIKEGLLKLQEVAEAYEADAAKYAALQEEHAELKEAHSKLQGDTGPVAKESRAILLVLDPEQNPMKAEKIAEVLSADPSRIRYLLTKLKEKELVREVGTGFYIKDEGRQTLHEP